MAKPDATPAPRDDSEAFRRLAPAVLKYSSRQFDLANDLKQLDRVQSVGASEASIFYSARILEALSADALLAVGLPTSPIVLSNLVLLEQFDLIPTSTRYWAHALRRLGNTVRHLQERVTVQDAELSLEFVERMLKWFFCDPRGGRGLPAVTVDGQPIWPDQMHPQLHSVMESFEAPRFDPVKTARELENQQTDILDATPALPAVLADMLLEHGNLPEAKRVLVRARSAHPADVRLKQLMGLYHSRVGEFKEALSYLEPLYEKYADDEETAGILGGIYKRCWQHEGTRTEWLVKSHKAYRRGWERSKFSNAYCGINAATTALWLGRSKESQEIAAKVRDLLHHRAEAVRSTPGLCFDYWNQVSLAEAELLAGNVPDAQTLYRNAIAGHRSRKGDLKVSRCQLAAILPCIGVSAGPDEFVEPESWGQDDSQCTSA